MLSGSHPIVRAEIETMWLSAPVFGCIVLSFSIILALTLVAFDIVNRRPRLKERVQHGCSLCWPVLHFVAWMMVFPVILTENKDACSGFSRTFELTSGRRMTVYSCIFLYLLFQLVVGWTWQALCFLLPLSKFLVPLNFLPGLFFLPIHAILQTVVYLNLRIDKESLNVDVLQRDLSMDDSRYTPLLSLEEDDEDEHDHDNGGDNEKVVSFAADPETVNKVHETSEVV